MKPLYWDRVILSSNDSKNIWSQVDEVNLDNLDDLVDGFSSKVDTKAIQVKKDVPQSILDNKRSQNIGIISKKLPVKKIMSALYNFSFQNDLHVDDLVKIEFHKATEEELEKFSNLEDYEKLDSAERWLLDLSNINCLSERIFCMKIQANFYEIIDEILKNLMLIDKLTHFFMESDELKKLLSIILTCGNYMNGGNLNKGQADGFGLKILAKLKDVKSNDPKITLLHFIVNTFVSKGGKEISELNHVEFCKDSDFDEFENEIHKLKTSINGEFL